ncbi:zinc metalloprotease HtpX [Mesorhizobium sp. DCY119]|uniref:zinc metalloprotease HtpX n=1 Tax=Mesorhizobium sp. DCY119 TaxID=2108445 RepID=UPI000E6CEDCA|nr:zinc metalloprotease HtpX [Mesorhizobium sp. DCY119]RJG43262.1 peptidase M48 Ste24p [Mesorhizobium sp. DCY119]
MSPNRTINLFAQRRNRVVNTLHTWLLGAASLFLLAITAWAFGGVTGVIFAVIFGAVSMAAIRRVSPQMVLGMYKAKPVSPEMFPTGFRIVSDLARWAGLPSTPKLHVIPSKMMNAFAVGRREDSAIAITDALARNLSTRELAGVLAHEMSHIAHEDVKVMAFADMVSRFTSIMSTVGLFSLFLNIGGFFGGMGQQIPWLGVLVLLAAPTIGGLLQMALSRTREFDADLGAAMLTGDPDGLASALAKLEKAQGRRWENILLPGGRIPDPSILRTHPRTEDRVARLMALKAAQAAEDGIALPMGTPAQPRPSIVPKIRPSAASPFEPTANIHALLAMPDAPVPADGADIELPACIASLNPPQSAPRVRFRRGGVYW